MVDSEMSDYYLKMQTLHELREAMKIKEINEELLETLQSSLIWLVRYGKANGIELKDRDRILSLLQRSYQLIQQIYPDSTNQSATTKQNNQRRNRVLSCTLSPSVGVLFGCRFLVGSMGSVPLSVYLSRCFRAGDG